MYDEIGTESYAPKVSRHGLLLDYRIFTYALAELKHGFGPAKDQLAISAPLSASLVYILCEVATFEHDEFLSSTPGLLMRISFKQTYAF